MTNAVNQMRVSSWDQLHAQLHHDSWKANLGRFRSNFAFRGMEDASDDLTTTLYRLGGPFLNQEGHLLRNFRKYAHRDAVPGDSLWNWLSLGYTPAGVEVWNAMRALDYLQTRPEVDPKLIGLTGISGGGAMTWYTAAVDERITAAAPVCSTFTFGSQAEHWVARFGPRATRTSWSAPRTRSIRARS